MQMRNTSPAHVVFQGAPKLPDLQEMRQIMTLCATRQTMSALQTQLLAVHPTFTISERHQETHFGVKSTQPSYV